MYEKPELSVMCKHLHVLQHKDIAHALLVSSLEYVAILHVGLMAGCRDYSFPVGELKNIYLSELLYILIRHS